MSADTRDRSEPDLAVLRDLAVAVAVEAGRLLVTERPQRLEVGTKSTPTDVVTEMDRAAEALILDRLRAARPDDGFLGEEGGAGEGTTGVRWVVDPIDGTVNYLYGLPAFAVSIAAELGGEVVVGVVHDPSLGRTFQAVRGQGATRDGVEIHCSDETRLDRALVATGFGYAAARRAAQARLLTSVLPRVRDIRRFGAASLDLCMVGSGLVDAFYERGLSPWDLAAGGLIATEAGARLGGLYGAPAGGDLVIAAPPALFDALHELLATGVADRG